MKQGKSWALGIKSSINREASREFVQRMEFDPNELSSELLHRIRLLTFVQNSKVPAGAGGRARGGGGVGSMRPCHIAYAPTLGLPRIFLRGGAPAAPWTAPPNALRTLVALDPDVAGIR
jgi:hypothetical protein